MRRFTPVLAALVVYAAGFAIPAEWIMRVDSLTYVDGDVIQDRTVLTPIEADWQAKVVSLDGPLGSAACSGAVSWFYRNVGGTVRRMSLSTWVGRECVLQPGTYRLEAIWRPHWLVWQWTVGARSEVFVVESGSQ